jgi:predicted enzyme related to lactoylglutathione lyase
MGKRSSYAPGTFSWVDLATMDAAAAKAFYTDLFGWDTEDTDAGGGAVYTLCRIDGDTVCGMFEISPEMRAEGAPPNWTNYVTVADADAAAARVQELGGEVIDGAFDVLDAGRMAVLKDPQGAVFAVWQPRGRIGAERVNDVGCLCINELTTTDADAARAFYGDGRHGSRRPADRLGEQRREAQRHDLGRAGRGTAALAALLHRRVDRGHPRADARARRPGARWAAADPRRQHRDRARPAGRRLRPLRRQDRPVT